MGGIRPVWDQPGTTGITCMPRETAAAGPGLANPTISGLVMELICWAKSEIAVASATTTIMYLATTNPTTHPLDEASGIIASLAVVIKHCDSKHE